MGSRSEHLSSIFSGSPLSGFRNKIINGGFDIWQRGVSQSAAGHGSADRWRFYFGTGAGTVSRQAFDLGQADVPGNPRFFCRHDLSSLAGAGIGTAFGQRIEDVRTLAGRKATLSFYARAEYEQALGARAIQDFGTGGSPSAVVETHIADFAVGTGWQKFAATVTLPSVAGKVLGTARDHLRIDIGRPQANSIGGYLDIARVSLVEGDATPEADPFSPRHVGHELLLCQRYFEKSTDLTVAPENGANRHLQYNACAVTNTLARVAVPFSVPKFRAPDMAFFRTIDGTTDGQAAYFTGSAWQDASGTGAKNTNRTYFTLRFDGSFTQHNSLAASVGWTATAEL